MKLLPLLSLAFLLLQTELPRRSGTVEGVVTRLGAGQAVGRARVTLTRVGDSGDAAVVRDLRLPGLQGGVQSAGTPIPPVLTDDKGRFTIQTEEGLYAVQVQGNGYIPQMYGKRSASDTGTPVVVTAGQVTRDVNVILTPAATLSGSIRDEFNRPLVNVPVHLLRYSYNSEGERVYAPGSAVQTDDRGEYRMYWVTPGRYYVLAGRPTTAANPMVEMITLALGGAGAAGNRVPAVKGYAFYPGAADIENARAVDLPPGTELEAIDVTLVAKPRTYAIRGRLVDSKTGQPPAQASVFAVPQTAGLNTDGLEARLAMPNRNYSAATGRIEIRDLMPGVYSVMAVTPDPLAAARTGAPNQSSGVLTVSVSNSDVEDIVLALAPAGSIEGRLRVEGTIPAGTKINEIRVHLRPTGANSPAQRVMQAQLQASSGYYESGAAQTRADGTFRMANVPPGDYRLEVAAWILERPGSLAYIKEARFEGADALSSPLHLSGSGALDVVIAMGGRRLEGVVTDGRSQPVSGAQVVLVPDRARFRVELYQALTTDKGGRFATAPIAPGDYKVFAWESIEEFSWFDPDVLTRYESRSRTVHVTETSAETIDIRVIPADGAR
jgi:sarcosine oxidase gamma subunit